MVLSDPDSLLTDLDFVKVVESLGFEVFENSDTIALWYYLESHFNLNSGGRGSKLIIRTCNTEQSLLYSKLYSSRYLTNLFQQVRDDMRGDLSHVLMRNQSYIS